MRAVARTVEINGETGVRALKRLDESLDRGKLARYRGTKKRKCHELNHWIRSYRCRASPTDIKVHHPSSLAGVVVIGRVVLVLVAVIEFQLCRSTGEALYILAARLLAIRPRKRPSHPLTRYKPGGYRCLEWYHRALSTAILCTGIRSTGSSTHLAQPVSFILRLHTSRSCPEFLITRRSCTKVSSRSPRNPRKPRREGRSPANRYRMIRHVSFHDSIVFDRDTLLLCVIINY